MAAAYRPNQNRPVSPWSRALSQSRSILAPFPTGASRPEPVLSRPLDISLEMNKLSFSEQIIHLSLAFETCYKRNAINEVKSTFDILISHTRPRNKTGWAGVYDERFR